MALLVGALFAAGWQGHKWFTKPITKEVTKVITIHAGPPEQTPTAPVVDHGVVKPGVNFGTDSEMPKPPDSTLPPLTNPNQTTTITVQVPTPMKLQVFHQTELKWARNGDTYNIWNESRIWTRDEKGEALPGITADTTYNKDATLNLPVSFKVETPRERPWCIGGLYKFNPQGYGLFVDRDIAMFRVGAEVIRTQAHGITPATTEALVKAGVRF